MEINKLCADYCISVIRAVMQETAADPIPEGLTLEEIYEFAQLHNVEALLYYGLCQLDPDFTTDLWKHWENRVCMLLTQGVVQLADRDELFTVLTDAGIPLLPVKGSWLKEQYPNMEYRQMADLDMLIPRDRAEEAKKIMLSLGYETEAFEDAPNHAGYLKPPYTEVELHISLLIEDKEGYYDDVWDRVHPVEGYPCLYRFSPEDEYIFYILHQNKHLEDTGIGIRSFLDSVVMRSVYPDMDRDYLHRELSSLGLWETARKIEELADHWFVTGQPLPEELQDMADYTLSAGSYGNIDNRSRKRMEKLKEKYKNPVILAIAYWIIRICRPYDEMCHSYPILKKLPFLLPVYWIIRACMKFAHHPKDIWHHVKLVFTKRNEHG